MIIIYHRLSIYTNLLDNKKRHERNKITSQLTIDLFVWGGDTHSKAQQYTQQNNLIDSST